MKERKETEKEVYYTNESNDSGQLFDLLMNDNDEDDSGGRSGGAELVGPPVEQNTFNVEEEEDDDMINDGKDLEEQSEVHGNDEETVSGLEDHSTPISSNVVVDSSSSTLYHCNNTATTDNGSTTNKGKITKQLIQFDYDVLLSKTSSSVLQSKEKEEEMKKRYNNVDKDKDDTIEEKEDEDNDDLQVIIAEFEQQLLKDVALSLNDAGICNNSSGSVEDDDNQEGVRKVMVLRKVANNQDGSEGVQLVELSSLPLDEIDDSATCAKDTLQQSFSSSNEESIACYPVTGYMTAYFTSASNTDNDNATTSSSKDVQSKIQDIIQRTIMETSSSTLKDSVSPTIVGVYYVHDRETFTNNESQLDNDSSSHSNSNGQIASLLNTEPSSSSLNTGTLIGLILGTLAAFLLSLFILRRRRTKKQRKNGTEATAENDDGLDHECYARGNGNIKRNMVDEERSVIPQMAFSTSSSSSPPPFVVDNIPTHQEYSPKGQQQVDQWVSHTMTTETDMTLVVSNITSSSSKQRYSYNRSGNHYLDEEKEIIQEFDEDDYDDDDEEESYY